MDLSGATTEVVTPRKALSEADDKAAKERIEREKQEARVGEVQQELDALAKNTSHWILTLRRESPSLRRCSKAHGAPRLKPTRPSRRWMRCRR